MVTELNIQGRDRRDRLLRVLRALLHGVCDSGRRQDVDFATPASWRTFEKRHAECSAASVRQEVFTHQLNVGTLMQRPLTLCTTDPLPGLLEVLAKYQDEAYFGRGESIGHADTTRPWTLPIWREISATVPEDGLPLMLSVYSDGCNVAGASYHPVVLEPAHFCTKTHRSLDLMVTTTLFEEPRLCKTRQLNSREKAIKVQNVNLAVDATFCVAPRGDDWWIDGADRRSAAKALPESDRVRYRSAGARGTDRQNVLPMYSTGSVVW